MEETIAQDFGVGGIIFLFGLMFLGFRIMMGRAAIPVLLLASIFVAANMFPDDPAAKMITGALLQLVAPVFMLWILWQFFLKPIVEPNDKRHDK